MSHHMPGTGNRLRFLRECFGLSQKDLALLLGCTDAYISMLEHDKRRMGVELQDEVLQLFGLSADEFCAEQFPPQRLQPESGQALLLPEKSRVLLARLRQEPATVSVQHMTPSRRVHSPGARVAGKAAQALARVGGTLAPSELDRLFLLITTHTTRQQKQEFFRKVRNGWNLEEER